MLNKAIKPALLLLVGAMLAVCGLQCHPAFKIGMPLWQATVAVENLHIAQVTATAYAGESYQATAYPR